MSKIKIICTSTGCLDYAPKKYDALKKDIDQIRIHMFFRGKEYLEGIGFTPEEFYTALLDIKDTKKYLPHTGMPTHDEVASLFQKAIDEGHKEILVIALSSYLGGTWNFIRLVAKEFAEKAKIVVLDAKVTCFIEGFMALKAQELANNGASLEDIVREIEWIKARRAFVGADAKLDYLILNGRLKGGKAYMGKLMSICPVVYFNEAGELAPLTNAIGFHKALRKSDEWLRNQIGGRSPEDYILFRVYTGEGLTEKLKALEPSAGLCPNHEDVIMSTVTGCNLGPWAAGYGYIPLRKEEEPLPELPDYYFEQLGISR